MKKAYFQYYETFEVILEKIQLKDQRDEMRHAIIDYGLYGKVPQSMTEVEDIVFTICRDIIDQQRHRCEINTQNAAKKGQVFKKPTVKQIEAYCKEKGYNVNAERFYAYYEANGWKVGRNAMKSWQAAVVHWSNRDKAAGTAWASNSSDSKTSSYENAFN